MTTLSGLSLAVACPGSATLPHQARASGAANLGTAIHELAQAQIDGLRADDYDIAGRLALAHNLAPDDAGRLAFLATHLRLPIPAGALAEVPLGYWIPTRDEQVTTGRVRRFTAEEMAEARARGLRYPDAGQALSGTLDAMWAEPYPLRIYQAIGMVPEHVECPAESTLWVYDAKTGDEQNVPPPDRNWQLRAGAVMAARWTGATRVIPAICYVNAAECAVAVREGRPYEGRWEVGAPLDLAALDAIEADMCAVLARARGGEDGGRADEEEGEDGGGPVRGGKDGDRYGGRGARSDGAGGEGEAPPGRSREAQRGSGPLILGPHCEHCPARGACPAIAAEAVSLARAAGSYAPPADGMALPEAARSYLAGILPAMRATLDAIEEAVRAGGPVTLADGREYGPALEPVTTYRTALTHDALSDVVGEEAASEAAEYTSASIKRALSEAGAPRGAWSRLRKVLEANGAVVVTAHEVWRRRYPAMPVEVEDASTADDRGPAERSGCAGDGAAARVEAPLLRGELDHGADQVPADDEAPPAQARARVARPLPPDFAAPLSGRTLRLLEGMGFDAPARAALVERYRASVAGQERKAWRESWLHDFACAEREAADELRRG